MGKKKGRTIYNIGELNLEIDYDKLAEAISKANEKQSNQYSVSREWMKFIIYPIFWCVTIVTGLLAIAFFIHGAREMIVQLGTTLDAANWTLIATSFLMLCIGLFLFGISVFTGATAKEFDKETDRQYVASMFSNIVALVALVVSLIALVKG